MSSYGCIAFEAATSLSGVASWVAIADLLMRLIDKVQLANESLGENPYIF
ncbi:MAG: hypothetical protein RMX68_021260 [Aulosira sp. ZfuVER01]|nr:hypothetical protein [Aulosira sp. ZfuCHP01]